MEVLTGLLIVGLYKATEKIWEKGFDAAWEPVGEALKGRFTRWAGRDKETERQAAFARAAGIARANTLRYAADPQQAEKILDALNGERDKRGAEALAEEAAKLMLFSAAPDVPRLTEICHRTLRFETLFKETPPPPEAVAAVLSDFLSNLREALLDQPAYHHLVGRETLRALREIVAELRPVAYDSEATYRAQVAEMYRQLEFVGIPELKERRPITVEDIFIRLRAERQIEVIPDWELEEQIEDAVARRDAHQLTALSARQRARARTGLIGRRVTPEERRQWSEELEAAAEARDAKAVVTLQRRLERTAPLVTEISVEESLKQANRIVILGDPGAGKTTLLKYLTVICAERRAHEELGLTVGSDGDSPLPIFVPLREFAAECAQREEDYCLLDHLYTCAREHLLLNLPPGFFEEALDNGRCLVCLDGLDEVWAVGQRKSVRGAVKALATRFRRSRYLVTSRIVGYEEAPLDRRDFVHHTILPFEDDDIRLFVRKWYEARERDPVQRKQKADDLIDTIEREPRIRSLAQNPLLLTIIALVHRIEAELPHERVKLYDKCVTALVETWEEVKGLSLEEKQRPFYRYRRRLLERLAYELHTQAEEPGQLRTVREGDLELLLGRFLMENRRLGFAEDPDGAREEARAFIHLARGRTGLLVERGEGVFGFPHLTFQEYLAACDIENRCIHRGVEAIWEEIEPRLYDPHWREVVLLLLGSLNKYDEPPTLLVERILEAGQDDKFEPVLHRHLYLAARALADRVDVADELHQDMVYDLLTIARSGPEWEGDDALAALSWLKGDSYVGDGLLALARDQQVDAEVRAAAAAALGQLGCAEEAVEILLPLARDPEVDAWLRRDAAKTLAQLGRTEEAGGILLALTRNPKVSDMDRILAASALGSLDRADEAAEILLALTRSLHGDSTARIFALTFLRILSDTEDKALNGLLALAHDPQVESWARVVAVTFLVQLARKDKALDGLLALARDSQVDALTRLAAVSLGQLDRTDDKALDGLLTLACDSQVDDIVRGTAVRTLVQMGRTDKKLLSILLSLARDPQVAAEVRSAAAEAVGQLGRIKEAEEVLLTLARAPKVEASTRSVVAKALGQLGCPKEAEELLLTWIRNPKVEDMVRCQAALTLGQSDHADEAAEILLALARDAEVSAMVRKLAASRLGSLGRADESVDILLTLARDPQVETEMGIFAVSSLSELSRTENRALNGLLVLTCDPQVDDRVRGAAAEAFGRLGRAEDEVLDGLLALLSDSQMKGEVRYQVTLALAKLGGARDKVLNGLLALARDEKAGARVRSAAYESLKRLVGMVTN